MKCPECGNDMKNSYRCLRCGYQYKGIAEKQDDGEEKEDVTETREINERDVHLSRKGTAFGGSIFDELFGGGIFGGFGLGSIIGDFLGGIFGSESDGYDDDPRNYDDFGEPIERKDVFDSDSVEIDDFEIDDKDGKK